MLCLLDRSASDLFPDETIDSRAAEIGPNLQHPLIATTYSYSRQHFESPTDAKNLTASVTGVPPPPAKFLGFIEYRYWLA